MKTQSLTKAVIAVVGFLLLVAPAPVQARAWHGHSGNWGRGLDDLTARRVPGRATRPASRARWGPPARTTHSRS